MKTWRILPALTAMMAFAAADHGQFNLAHSSAISSTFFFELPESTILQGVEDDFQ